MTHSQAPAAGLDRSTAIRTSRVSGPNAWTARQNRSLRDGDESEATLSVNN